MRRWVAPFLLSFTPLLAAAADFPFSNPRPQWSRQSAEAEEYETVTAAISDNGSLWVVRQIKGGGTPGLWVFDRNGELQTLAASASSSSFSTRSGQMRNELPRPFTLSLFESAERVKRLDALAFCDDHDPLLILQLESGRVVSAKLTGGKLALLEELAGAGEKVVIHAAVTADDQAIFLLGERLGSAFLARLSGSGKLEWRRQMVWGKSDTKGSAKGTSRLLDGFPLIRGGVQVIGERDPAKAAAQVRVLQIDKAGDAGKEKSFPGRALALAGGIGRDGVALYESADPQSVLMMLSLDESLAENWREPLPIPARPADGRVSFKRAAEGGTLAAAVVDGRLWNVRLNRSGKTVWENRPEYRARSAAALSVPEHFFLITTVDTSGGQPPPFFALIVDKFAESE